MDAGIFLAAAGINILELSEASAVGLALYADSKSSSAFLYVALGVITVYVPTILAGRAIALLPVFWVRVVAATLLLYFGLRLARSARRSVIRSILGQNAKAKDERPERGIMLTGYTVGIVEAFEAAIVLIAVFPVSFTSAIYGTITGILVVALGTYALRSQVRKLKQAYMKIFVSALLLSFSTFWYAESVITINDLALIPLFAVYFTCVYLFAYKYKINAQKTSSN